MPLLSAGFTWSLGVAAVAGPERREAAGEANPGGMNGEGSGVWRGGLGALAYSNLQRSDTLCSRGS